MSLSGKYIWLSLKDSRMSETTVIRRLYGANAAKLLARENSVSPSAAKKWLSGGVPAGRSERVLAQARERLQGRLDELAELEAELDRLAAQRRRLSGREQR